MSVFSKEEQESINACAIAFAERDQIVIPKVNIAVNAKCSQADLMAYASSHGRKEMLHGSTMKSLDDVSILVGMDMLSNCKIHFEPYNYGFKYKIIFI